MKKTPLIAERYQILGTPAERVVSIEEATEAPPGLGSLSYRRDKFSEMAERARKSICEISMCTCRQEMHLLGRDCSRVDKGTSVACTLTGTTAESAINVGVWAGGDRRNSSSRRECTQRQEDLSRCATTRLIFS